MAIVRLRIDVQIQKRSKLCVSLTDNEDKKYNARIFDISSQLVFTSEIKIVFP